MSEELETTANGIDGGTKLEQNSEPEPAIEKEELEDLFGEGSDQENGGEGQSDGSQDEEEITRKHRVDFSGDEEDEDDEQAMYTRKFYGDNAGEDGYDEDSQKEFKEANIEISKHVVPYRTVASTEEKEVVYYARVPEFLTIDPIPFDPPAFKDGMEKRSKEFTSQEDQVGDRLIEENTIRWRYSRDASQHVFKESNAQIIEWSDGTFSLRLGDEFTDVLVNGIDNTYLAVSHDQQELIQSVEGGDISKTMIFIPTSTNSKIHKHLSKAVARREQREHQGPNTYIARVDPELEQKELEKKQGQIVRERRKRQHREQMEKENLDSPGPTALRKSQSILHGHGRVDEYEDDGFMVDDEDEEDFVDEDEAGEDDLEEEDDQDDLNAERLRQVKRAGAAAYEDNDDENDDREESESTSKETVLKRRKIAVADDDDE
ncbi:LAMI_0E13938g1_1 [Lachancea mirantina]|uniref:LAMI_0E13938g1_1 n=1 Tax=Lachancea mirantina TaxID=1230905 RepID=A0A1G4JRL2_9SACH|nr:LAMI_0E13938g1_1 [Lachancea mirantina]